MAATNVKTIFKTYLKDLSEVARRGDAREESFYSALATLLQEISQATHRTHVHVTTLPKPTDAGNPDFRLWNGTDRIIGYIEAKKPTEERLDIIEDTDQLKRYRSTFPNLILTNFLEFRLYRNGDRVDTVLCGRPVVLNQLRTTPPMENQEELHALLERFLDFSLPRAYTAESLAIELAKRTRFLRDIGLQQLLEERDQPGPLSGFYEAFEKYLIGDLTEVDFADLYAQTITYGLFAARTRTENGFNRRAAFDSIPHTIGVLRDLFRFISLGDLPEPLAWCVDDIAEVLAVADAPGILDRYYHEGKGSDPIVHFYETFLTQYDPAERERRGVYYTPEPVVGYIVRSLHSLLKTEFNKPDGLASEGVTLLDPAAGTMTFVAQAAQQAAREFASKYGTGAQEEFIRRHILNNFYAFELMMAPYAVGHLKMGFFLEELGHRLADDERIRFYLTNTLDTEEMETSRLPGFSSLAEESQLAGRVKKETSILVILGNPPYSGHSSNTGKWIRGLIDVYKQVDGKPLGEKNPKWLQDDYVKFLRFAQWKIAQAGCGVVGMITNHGYLDNPTFRGMRQSLMQTFDAIYIFDLHGNSLKKEVCPDGSSDQNVFDIRQGVAIAFFVKRGNKKKTNSTVHHAELWGVRKLKYDWLDTYSVDTMEWSKLSPGSPSYLFVPRDSALETIYQQYPSVPDIFPVNTVGIVTARDKLTIAWTKEEVWQRVRTFAQMDSEIAREAYSLGKDVQDWKVSLAQKDLSDSGLTRDKVVPLLYRPFDIRFTYYTGRARGFICRPRSQVMRQMVVGENLALAIGRAGQVIGSSEWDIALCSIEVTEFNLYRRGGNNLFPLYLYPNAHAGDLFAHLDGGKRQPNIDSMLIESLAAAYNQKPSPEQIFHYIYAVLYAPAYREKYADFLRRDFPRIPFTSDGELFLKVAELGERLTGLHLLKSPELDPPACRFQGEGDSRVGKGKKEGLRYDQETQRVYINPTQHFTPVPEVVWSYRIGGYQVCDKWLKDRKDRVLELKDIRTYCRMVTALN
ncbi:MAG: type ISP restriction/modification enzyme, partial [Desulfobacteraceae bacterium]